MVSNLGISMGTVVCTYLSMKLADPWTVLGDGWLHRLTARGHWAQRHAAGGSPSLWREPGGWQLFPQGACFQLRYGKSVACGNGFPP